MKKLILIPLILLFSIIGTSQTLIHEFEIEKTLKWEEDQQFYEFASDFNSEKRILEIAPDWSALTFTFIDVFGDTAYSMYLEIVHVQPSKLPNEEDITVIFAMDLEGYPFMFENKQDGTVAFYYKFDTPDTGYNGFLEAELLTPKKEKDEKIIVNNLPIK